MESVDYVLYWSPIGFFARLYLSCLLSKEVITAAGYYICGFFLSNEGSYYYFSLSYVVVVVGGRKDLLRDSLIVCFLCCREVMCTGEFTVEVSI